METTHDVIVIGAGPAGLTAAIYLGRARMRTLVVDSGTIGGQMVLTYSVANYPGVLEATGAQIAGVMRRQAEAFGAKIIGQADIKIVDLKGPTKVIEIEDEGVFSAPAVIIATGGIPRTLGLPSEEKFKGRGISFCATCDGDFFAGQDIVVIGGGNSALEESLSLAKVVNSITIVHEFDHFQAQPWVVEQVRANPKVKFLLEQDVREFVGDDTLKEVVSVHKRTGQVSRIPATGAFIFIGYVPNTKAFAGIVEMNEKGEIVSDERMRTSREGVFVAGDARQKPYRQITTAVGDGTVAALSAIEYVTNLARSAKGPGRDDRPA